MAERLTEYFECGAYTSKENIIDVSDKVKFFDNGCVMGKAIDKLAQLEDILEKYGIEDLEQYLLKMQKVDKELRDTIQQLHTIIDSIGYDRDNWQKACELACEREDDCYVYDNIHRAYEFYQQAKNSGENK